MEPTFSVELTANELRYVIRCGAALAQNVPNKSLPAYCGFDTDEINRFSERMRAQLDEAGLDM
jgi:hypothetical protein